MHWHADFLTSQAHFHGEEFLHGFCSQLNDPILNARIRSVGDRLIRQAVQRNVDAKLHPYRFSDSDGIMVDVSFMDGHAVILMVMDSAGACCPILDDDVVIQKMGHLKRYQLSHGLLTIVVFDLHDEPSLEPLL